MNLHLVNSNYTHISLAIAGMIGLVSSAHSAFGALMAYEGFNYPAAGSLAGQSGGGSFGFAQAWELGGLGTPQHQIEGASLSNSDGTLLASGNRAAVNSASPSGFTTARRALSQSLGAPGSRHYLSLLLRPEGQLGEGDAGGYFGLELVSSGTALFAGKPSSNQYVLEDIGGTDQVATGLEAAVDEAVLLVLRADFETGSDTFQLYVDPVPGQSEPVSPDAMKADSDVGTVTAIGLFSSGTFSFDEIRIGETFADVTPVPEPASVLLLLVGAAFSGVLPRRSRVLKQN